MDDNLEHIQPLPDPEPEEAEEQSEANTLMERLRAERQGMAEDQSIDISIPGYGDPVLLCRYRLVEGRELQRIMDKVRRQTKDSFDRNLLTTVDTFIAACEGIYIKEPDSEEEPVPLDPDNTGAPMQYEPSLAKFLGFEANNAREVVRGVFGENDNAIMQHGARLARWFGNTELTDTEEFLLGEV